MGISIGKDEEREEILTLLQPGGEAPSRITIERRLERIDGGALVSLHAHTGDPGNPILKYTNPFFRGGKGKTHQWHDDEIAVADCLMSLVHAFRTNTKPSYGAGQARIDQEIILALRQSAKEGGAPVTFPLEY
jgi:predicted dehydrogenase